MVWPGIAFDESPPQGGPMLLPEPARAVKYKPSIGREKSGNVQVAARNGIYEKRAFWGLADRRIVAQASCLPHVSTWTNNLRERFRNLETAV